MHTYLVTYTLHGLYRTAELRSDGDTYQVFTEFYNTWEYDRILQITLTSSFNLYD